MPSPAIRQAPLRIEDYLAGERDVDTKSEYVDGQVYAMAGASETHNTLSASLLLAIGNHIADDGYAWQSDMKVVGENKGRQFSYYPDVMVACGENEGDQYVRTNPLLIAEVLSPATRRIDLTEKLENYTAIPTLVEYLVIAQDVPLVRLYRRRTAWQMESYDAGDSLSLESIQLELPVITIYRKVLKAVGLETGHQDTQADC